MQRKDKFARVVPYIEFCNRFLPYKSLIACNRLLLCVFTLQARDAAFNNAKCTCSIALGYETKNNIALDTSCIDGINKREASKLPFKVYSKKQNACVWVVLLLQFISID